MKIQEIIDALELAAPLRLQEEYDNSGLQAGFPDRELTGVLVCLDVTEAVLEEAVSRGCNMVVSHHPLLFRPLRTVSDVTYQQRCVVDAIKQDIVIYSSHTCLDNAPGGVNHKIASLLNLPSLRWLQPIAGEDAGSGLVGELPAPMDAADFLALLKSVFGVKALLHSELPTSPVKTVALCGGAGAFLMKPARAAGADCFISGEFHYHDYFENDGMLLAELGHYQSEQYTIDLLHDIIKAAFPDARVEKTAIDTNPIRYSL